MTSLARRISPRRPRPVAAGTAAGARPERSVARAAVSTEDIPGRPRSPGGRAALGNGGPARRQRRRREDRAAPLRRGALLDPLDELGDAEGLTDERPAAVPERRDL